MIIDCIILYFSIFSTNDDDNDCAWWSNFESPFGEVFAFIRFSRSDEPSVCFTITKFGCPPTILMSLILVLLKLLLRLVVEFVILCFGIDEEKFLEINFAEVDGMINLSFWGVLDSDEYQIAGWVMIDPLVDGSSGCLFPLICAESVEALGDFFWVLFCVVLFKLYVLVPVEAEEVVVFLLHPICDHVNDVVSWS